MNPNEADFSSLSNENSVSFDETPENTADFSEVKPQYKARPGRIERLIAEIKGKPIQMPEKKKEKIPETMEEDVKQDIERRKKVAKGTVKGTVSGLTFGITDKYMKPPKSDEEAAAYNLGEVVGSVVPITIAEKAIVSPIVSLAKQTGAASKYLAPFARLAGWGGVGATEETIKSAVTEGELPSKEDILKRGVAYAAIDAIMQGLGAGFSFTKKIENLSESGFSKKEVLNEIIETIKGNRKGVTDWKKVDPEVIMEATQEVEQKLLEGPKEFEVKGKEPEGPIPVEPTDKGLVEEGTNLPVPKDTKEIEIRAEDIDPFTKEKKNVNVNYIPPSKGTSREQIAEHVALEPPQVAEKPSMTKNELIRRYYDDIHPLQVLAEQAAVDPERNPYMLANIARNFEGKATAVLEHGQYDYITKKFTGPGIKQMFSKDAIEKIPGFDHTDLKYYLVAGSSLDRQAIGQLNPIPTQAAVQFLKENQKYFPIAKQLVEFSEQGFLNEKNNGWWSENEFQNAKENYKSYVPLYRYIEQEPEVLSGKKSFKPKSIRRQAKGSKKKILDPIQSIVKNAVIREQALAKNDVMNATRDALEKLGYKAEAAEPVLIQKNELQKIMGDSYQVADAQIPFLSKAKEFYGKEAFKAKDGTIYGYRDGKKWVMRGVPDNVLQAINSMGAIDRMWLEKAGHAMVKFYSMVRVGMPSTQLRIIAQDAFLSAFTSKTLEPIIGPFQQFFVDWPVAMFETFSNKEIYKQFLLSGAAQKSMLRDIGPDRIVKTSADLTRESKLVKKSFYRFMGDLAKKLGRSYGETLDKMSSALKLAEYKRSIKKGAGPVESAYNALEMSLNYSKKGASRTLSFLKNVTPWLNTIVLDTGKIIETAAKPGTKQFNNLLVNMAALSLFGMYYYQLNKDDKRYQALPDREKEMYYHFYLTNSSKEEPLKLRRFWMHGALSSGLGESAAEFIDTKDQSAFVPFYETILTELLPIEIPGLKGKSQIVRSYAEKLDAELQYTGSTSETAKVAAKYIQKIIPETRLTEGLRNTISPIFVDYCIGLMFARFGSVGTRLLDDYVVATDKKNLRPEEKLADSFWVGSFFGRGPKKSTAHLEDYYKFYDQNEIYKKSEAAYRNQNKNKEANEYSKAHPWVDMKDSKNIINAKLREIDHVFSSTKYSRKEKRDKLDQKYIELSELYRDFYERAKNQVEKKKSKK